MSIALSIASPLLANGQHKNASFAKQLAALENHNAGHIGLFAINTANHQQLYYHQNQRFPMCSTAKLMTVAAILKKSMTTPTLLQQRIHYQQKELTASSYAPITKKHLQTGMSISALCAAAISYSDNTAMNLLMKQLGGPQAVTHFARSMGDQQFRLDRWEPNLNSAIPGDKRDTTTAKAMATSLRQLTIGDALSTTQQQKLQNWLKANTTGNQRIRAAVPKTWLVGDKTGTGRYGSTNDIAVIWPAHCPPIVIAIYFTQDKKNATPRDDVIASAAKIVITTFAKQDSCLNT